MATLADTIDIQPTTQNPDFEPDEEWKNNLRQHIEVSLKPQVELLKREFNEKRKGLPPPYNSRTQTDYDNAMAGLRRKAAEEYCQLLERERQERRFAAGEKVDEKWSEIFLKEQQALLDLYKKDRLTINPRRSFTDESRQPPRWFPPPQTSDPRPIKFKSSFRVDDDDDFPPTASPQEEYRPWKIPSSKPPSIRSRSSITSLIHGPPITHPPPKHHPGDEESVSDSEDDSEEDWKQRLEAEFSLRERNAKQMEDEVARRKEELLRKEEEARRKEEEVLAKEEEVRLMEEEVRRKEEEARLMEEEVRRKDDDIRKREREIRRKEDVLKRRDKELTDREAALQTREQREEEERRVKQEADAEAVLQVTAKEEEIKQKEDELEKREAELERREFEIKVEEARKEEELERKEEEVLAKEEEAKLMEEEVRRKEEEARLMEEEVRRKEDDIRKREREIRRKEDVLKRRDKELTDREAALQTREQREEEERRAKQEADSEAVLQVTAKEEEDATRMEEARRKEDDIRNRECGSNGRDRSVSCGSPLPPAPEIRKPPLSISSHALEYSSRKRGSGADNDTATSSSSRHSSGDTSGGTSIGFDMGEASARLHPRPTVLVTPPTVSPSLPIPFHQLARSAGSFLSFPVAHSTTLGPPSGRPKMLQSVSDDEREERIHQHQRWTPTIATPDLLAKTRSSFLSSSIKHPATVRSNIPQPFPESRSSTDEPRQPSRWYPPPQTSDPQPIQSKSSFRVGDGGFPSKPGVTWTSASDAFNHYTSTANSQGPTLVRTPAMTTSAGRPSSGGQPVHGASTSDPLPYQSPSVSPEEWEKRQQEQARRQQEQFRREQERKEELERKDELEKREAELERQGAEVMAKEERLRQEEANRLAREEEERRRVRRVLREVRDRGGVLV